MAEEDPRAFLGATVRDEWSCVLVELTGEADIANEGRLRSLLRGAGDRRPDGTFIVDLSGAFFAVCALRVLVEWAVELTARGGLVAIAGASGSLRRAIPLLDPTGVLAVLGPDEPPADRGANVRPTRS